VVVNFGAIDGGIVLAGVNYVTAGRPVAMRAVLGHVRGIGMRGGCTSKEYGVRIVLLDFRVRLGDYGHTRTSHPNYMSQVMLIF
jgi:hypothetical protein